MTAETLKPFITPTSAVDNFPAMAMQSSASRSQRKTKLIAIGLSAAALALAVILLSLTIWHSTRVAHLETELAGLKRVVDSLQQRLGINYLEDLDDFEREYEKALIEDPNKFDDRDLIDDEQDQDEAWRNENEDDDEDEDDDSRDYMDYADLINKYNKYSDETTEGEAEAEAEADTDASNNDNVFDDFRNYNDSKKKKERKSRSIAEAHNDIQSFELLQNKTEQQQQKTGMSVPLPEAKGATMARRKPPAHSRHAMQFRQRTGRRRQLPQIKSGESLISAKIAHGRASLSATPAAHFHLNRKVSHHNAPISLQSYQGDMYIGHATASSENAWQQYFSVVDGILTVHEPGLYYVYAQICYNNTHDQNGFIIFHGHKPFLQCLNTVPTNMPQKVHTCHTSGLIQLQEQESIHLRDIHSDRNVMLKDANNRSYFGLIKV